MSIFPLPCPADSVLLDEAIARFKTPGLRDLGHSAPYMHNGQFDHIGQRGRVLSRFIKREAGGNASQWRQRVTRYCLDSGRHRTACGIPQVAERGLPIGEINNSSRYSAGARYTGNGVRGVVPSHSAGGGRHFFPRLPPLSFKKGDREMTDYVEQ